MIPIRKFAALVALVGAVAAFSAAAQDARSLRERHAALAPQLAQNDFKRPLYIESAQESGRLSGEVYAVLERPFDSLAAALRRRESWCEILILHLNVKQCVPRDADRLAVAIGRKFEEPVERAYAVEFRYRAGAADPDYLQVSLEAPTGPFSTRNYRIALEATPLGAGSTFLHLAYAYEYGTAARLAMDAYLGTLGRGKVGFTILRDPSSGRAAPVQGLRGVVERNAMRYFLAIEAYVDSLSAPLGERLERRLAGWFDATERYPAQLHELDRAEYLDMKRHETARQAAR
ncbi:MAG: hypothetical protein ACM30H_00670 [Clostridia bacterium]